MAIDDPVDEVTWERDDTSGELEDEVGLKDEEQESTPTEDAQTTETPTPTPTATPTPEPTATPTRSDGAASSPTPTPTDTRPESETATPTPTSTPPDESDDGDGSGTDGTSGSDDADDRSTDSADDSDDDGDSTDDETGTGTDRQDGENGTSADADSRDPDDFEEPFDGGGPGAPDATTPADGPGGEPGAVAARTVRRMPPRGPTDGTFVVSFDDVPVSSIAFTKRQWGNVSIVVLEGLPRDVDAPRGHRLSLLRITVPAAVRDSPAKVMFTVDAATLEAAAVPDDAVWLARYDADSGEWDRLETTVLHASGDTVTYRAETPGFSLFAVQGDASRDRDPSPTGTNEAAGNVTTGDEAEATFLGGFGFSMGFLLFMGAVSVCTTVFGARRVSTGEAVEGEDRRERELSESIG